LDLEYTYLAEGVAGAATAKLSGTGYAPALTVLPRGLQFGPQAVLTHSPAQIITVTNPRTADGNRTVSAVTASDDFLVQSQSCSEPLPPGESCRIVVSFVPQREGDASGVLRIGDSVKASLEVALRGSSENCWGRRWSCQWGGLAAVIVTCLLYWFGMLLVRWNRIAKGTRRLLGAQVDSSILHCEALEKLGAPPVIRTGLLEPTRDWLAKSSGRMGDFLFWSRGQELAGWARVHEAEIKMAEYLPPDEVQARLEVLQQQLAALDDSTATELARLIQQSIGGNVVPARQKALLAEALNKHYDKTDTSFADLLSWQNKTGWIVWCGLLLIITLAAALNHAELFLLGATGGLLSRLSRSLRRNDVPTDYGASWTTLFLSPVAGALGGWGGVLLAALGSELNVIGTALHVKWEENSGIVMLGLAFLFGFSERAFDTILSSLEKKVADSSGQQPATSKGLQLTTGSELTSATVGQDYRVELKASGGSGALAWRKTEGNLPDGLQLGANGVITGKALAAAAGKTFTFTVEVKDSSSKQTQQFTIKVN